MNPLKRPRKKTQKSPLKRPRKKHKNLIQILLVPRLMFTTIVLR